MKAEEFRSLKEEELDKKYAELTEELFNLRVQVATQQSTNVGRIKDLRKDIARVKTVLREKAAVRGEN